MNTRDLVIHESQQMPETLLQEVLDYMRFLRTKYNLEKLETAVLSESSLNKDWLSKEEDEAWQNL